jgi:hypothetical protein
MISMFCAEPWLYESERNGINAIELSKSIYSTDSYQQADSWSLCDCRIPHRIRFLEQSTFRSFQYFLQE